MKLSPNAGETEFAKEFVRSVLPPGKITIPGIRVLKQGWGRLHRGQSISEGVITIGGKTYQHGLGTHAVSEILVSLPEDAEFFTAEVGWDFNAYTKQNSHGKLVFTVKSQNKVIWKSASLTVQDKPVKVCVSIKGLREIILGVDDDGTGIERTHADWADAGIIFKNGRKVWVES